MKPKISLVWLKRDLRTSDHPPFAEAIAIGLPIYAFYLWEPKIFQLPDWDVRHTQFILQSLDSLNHELIPFNARIHIHTIDALPFFSYCLEKWDVQFVFSHQETGNHATYERDQGVAQFLKKRGIPWKEYKPSYIVRGLISGRMGWKEKWKDWMERPTVEPNWKKAKEQNLFIQTSLPLSNKEPIESYFKLEATKNSQFQVGGIYEAEKTLQSFLKERYKKYSGCISKPEESRTHCSRLSPYLAWGNLSAKQVYQRTQSRRQDINHFGKRQLDNFLSRLAWRDHMIQKFESECRIEFENFNPGYDCIQHEKREDYIYAWQEGRTGFPLVDACMRCLKETGYLNFRMRAMLVSFFTMILWQDWRWGVHFLARQFLDYEPGIHYFQFQMQASRVGNHQIRIYNPQKQIIDNDPNCTFIRKWIPEIANLSTPEILNWGSSESEITLFSHAVDYPKPILDFKKAYNHARDTMFRLQKSPEVIRHLERIRSIHVVDRRNQSFR